MQGIREQGWTGLGQDETGVTGTGLHIALLELTGPWAEELIESSI